MRASGPHCDLKNKKGCDASRSYNILSAGNRLLSSKPVSVANWHFFFIMHTFRTPIPSRTISRETLGRLFSNYSLPVCCGRGRNFESLAFSNLTIILFYFYFMERKRRKRILSIVTLTEF